MDFVFDLTLGNPNNGLLRLFVAIAKVCRTFYERVTSAKARRRPFVDVECMMDIPDEMERLTTILAICEDNCRLYITGQAWPNNLGYWLRVGRLLCKCADQALPLAVFDEYISFILGQVPSS